MHHNTSKTLPEFVLYTGCMYSGKTSRAILEAHNHHYRGRRVLVYKPKIDDRYSKNEVTTHSGMGSLPAVTVSSGKDLIENLLQISDIKASETTVVVDEVFMIKGVSQELIWLYRKGFSIIASSLDMSSSLQPFEEIVKIMPWATRIERCSAVCSVCKEPAHFTWRKPDAGDDEILVGGVEIYEARCALCHPFFNVE